MLQCVLGIDGEEGGEPFGGARHIFADGHGAVGGGVEEERREGVVLEAGHLVLGALEARKAQARRGGVFGGVFGSSSEEIAWGASKAGPECELIMRRKSGTEGSEVDVSASAW